MIGRSHREIRTLVIHTGGIGDFLLFCPCLKRLAEDGPVELAGLERDRLNLAVVSGLAQTAHLLDDFDFASVFNHPSPSFESFAVRFQRVIVWMQDDDGTVRKAFANAGVRETRAFPGLPPDANWTRHASEYYADCLGYTDLPPLLLPFEPHDASHDILIHPGSGGKRKNWPMDRFAMAANALQKRGRQIEWVRGPAEEDLSIPRDAEVLEFASIVTLARHLTSANLYIGNDSGVTHLAAACGCRTVAIFSPTDPRVWAPRGNHVTVAASASWPSVEEVLDVLFRCLTGTHKFRDKPR